MYKVFIDNKVILFCENLKKVKKWDQEVVFTIDDFSGLEIIGLRQQLPLEVRLTIVTPNPETTINDLFADYTWMEAAGGLVNRKNSYLFIERLGVWDLPKGKIETDEAPEAAAVREIEEECGIETPKIARMLGITYHTYELKGKPVIKKNYWYLLKFNGPKALIPQTEEDITQAIWLPKNKLDIIRENTYASILEVLNFLDRKSKK